MGDLDKARLTRYLDQLIAHAIDQELEAEGQHERITQTHWNGYREALLHLLKVIEAGKLD